MSERFFKRLDEIDKLIAAAPSADAVRKLRDLVLELSSEWYLFNAIKPEWLPALEREGWFRTPPEPKTDARGTQVVRWPASDYLVRVIKRTDQTKDSQLVAPAKRIIQNIPIVRNPFIFKNIIEVLLELPISDVADLSLVLQSWLGQQSAVWGKGVPALIGTLAHSGFEAASLRLTRAVFAVLPDMKFYSQTEEHRLLPEPRALMREWEYEQQLSEVLSEIERGSLGLVTLLSQLLHDAVRFSQKDLSYQGPWDTSFVWRPAVEEHAQNRDVSVKNVLVRALRDTCEQFLRHEPNRFGELIEVLQVQQWFIFTRIVLHLLRVSPAARSESISEYLTNRSYFDEVTVRHEYALLLKAHFGNLTVDAQRKVLSFISEGPDTISYTRGYKRWSDKEPDEKQIDSYAKHWQLDWLAFIQDYLTLEWKDYFVTLSLGATPSRHPEFPTYSEGGSYAVTQSPISSEDLSKKTPLEVLEYIRDWSPPPSKSEGSGMWPREDSVAGLASTLTSAVAGKPEEFSAIAEQFIGLEATYVHGFLEGIYIAARKPDQIFWPAVITLCSWASGQEGETKSRDPYADRDPSWTWAKQAITRVLQEGLDDKSNQLQLELREEVWNTIHALLYSRDAIQGNEDAELSSEFDPLTRSLNTVAGAALHAAIKYALWVRHQDKGFRGAASIPEVATTLEHVLEHAEIYGVTSRAVLGQWFPWLVLIDPEWARTYVNSIFPEDEEKLSLWEAAWTAYLGYCAPYDQPFELLQGKYAFAIRHLSKGLGFRSTVFKPAERLGEHLLSFYWRGKLDLENDGLVRRYLRTCDTNTCKHCIEFIGRSLGNSVDVQREVIERLQALVDLIIDESDRATLPSESLVAFGSWFSCGQFDEQWKMNRLLEVLRRASRVDSTEDVLERLQPLAEKFPLEAAEAVLMIAQGDYEPWDFEYWSPKAFAVLEKAVSSGREDVKSIVAEAAEQFGLKGRLEFRQFVVAQP